MDELLKYYLSEFEDITVLELNGSINSSTVELLGRIIRHLSDEISIIINLKSISSITTAGLKTLTDISFDAKEENKRVVLLGASDDFIRMTEIYDLYNIFTFATTLQEGKMKINLFVED